MKHVKKVLFVLLFVIAAFTIAGCKKGLTQAQFDEAVKIVAPTVNTNVEVKGDFKVITKGKYDVDIKWTVDNAELAEVGTELDASGQITIKVKKPAYVEGAEPKTFKLTATITHGKFTDKKDFTIKVAYESPDTKVLTIADIQDPSKLEELKKVANDEDQVRFNDVIVVGVGMGHFMVADAEGRAILVYVYNDDNIPTEAKIGNKVNISNVKIAYFYGAFQITTIAKDVLPSLTIVESEVAPKETEITVAKLFDAIQGKSKDEVEALGNNPEYKRYLKISAITAVNTNTTNDQYKVKFVDPTNAEKWVGAAYRADKLYQEILDLGADVPVTLYAVPYEFRHNDGDYGNDNNVRLAVYKYEVGTMTDAQKAQADANAAAKDKEFLEAGTLELPKTGKFESALTYAFADETDPNNVLIDLETGAVTLPEDGKQAKVIIKVTSKNGEETSNKDFTVTIGVLQVVTIAELLAATPTQDSTYTVKGVIGRKPEIADDKNGNVQLHDLDNGKGLVIRGLGSVFGAAKTGDFVEATGQYNLYHGTHQLQNLTEVKVIESGKTITPAEITTFDEIKALTAEDQGRLFNVKVPNLKILEVKERSIMVGLDDENKVEVYSIATLVKDLVVGQKVELANALGSQYNGNFQFDAQVADVIVATSLTDAEKIQVIKDELVAIYGDKEVNMNSSQLLPLPTALHGSTISWGTTPEGAIVDGKWKTVEANLAVVLTATIKSGEVEETQVLNVTIKFVDPSAPEPVTVTTTLPSAQVTVTDELNVASDFGLDPTIFTINILKNGANPPALRTDGVRLYSVRAIGTGNLLKIQMADGYKIKSISFQRDSGTTTENGTVHVDGTLLLERGDIFTTELFSDLDASLFQLDNSYQGGDKNLQLRFLSITITYVKVS